MSEYRDLNPPSHDALGAGMQSGNVVVVDWRSMSQPQLLAEQAACNAEIERRIAELSASRPKRGRKPRDESGE